MCSTRDLRRLMMWETNAVNILGHTTCIVHTRTCSIHRHSRLRRSLPYLPFSFAEHKYCIQDTVPHSSFDTSRDAGSVHTSYQAGLPPCLVLPFIYHCRILSLLMLHRSSALGLHRCAFTTTPFHLYSTTLFPDSRYLPCLSLRQEHNTSSLLEIERYSEPSGLESHQGLTRLIFSTSCDLSLPVMDNPPVLDKYGLFPRPPEPPTGSLPIRASFLRRYATLCAVRLAEHYRKPNNGVLYISSTICIKYTTMNKPFINLSEAASMEFIRRHTSIPVPKIYCAFEHKGKTYIVMQRMKGKKLAIGWETERSEESRTRILAQLKSYVDEMRTLKSPHGSRVASVDGGSLYDERMDGVGVVAPNPTPMRFGPFKDISAFHFWFTPVKEVDEEWTRNGLSDINKLVTMHHSRDWGTPVFTHGDLSSLNILVQGEKITGIIDWETAGW